VRHDALCGLPLPGRCLGGELQPGGQQLPMIRYWGAGELVHPSCHPFQRSSGDDEALQGRAAHPGNLKLTTGNQAPLFLCQFLNA
jgi:hypothetical protein